MRMWHAQFIRRAAGDGVSPYRFRGFRNPRIILREVTMLYRSKKDWWLVLLVWTAIMLPLALGGFLLFGGKTEAGWYLLFVGGVTGTVVVWLTCPLNYEITASALIVRSGFMRKEILLSSIEEIRPTRNPLSAPAWSLDRLYV